MSWCGAWLTTNFDAGTYDELKSSSSSILKTSVKLHVAAVKRMSGDAFYYTDRQSRNEDMWLTDH